MRPKRTYRACTACRTRKVRCDVGNTSQPMFPCLRCRRMNLDCVPSIPNAPEKDQAGACPENTGAAPDTGFRVLGSATWDASPLPQLSHPKNEQSNPDATQGTGDMEPYALIEEAVHNPTDALNVLLRAAQLPNSKGLKMQSSNKALPTDDGLLTAARAASNDGAESGDTDLRSPSPPNPVSHHAWSKCWLVRRGWLRPEEAAWFVGEFFKVLGPVTPILSNFFADSQTHDQLVVSEPILCYTILTISSMFHSLPMSSNSPSNELLHVKSWSIVKGLCERVLWAEERGSKSRLRTFGTILALLLLVEWPPRAATSLPPDDLSDVIVQEEVSSLITPMHQPRILEDSDRHIRIANATQWMAELSQPIIRSDRMSGMLLGMAWSLANELDTTSLRNRAPESNAEVMSREERYVYRRTRVRLLIHIYMTQSAIVPRVSWNQHQGLVNVDTATLERRAAVAGANERKWLRAVLAWASLSKLAHDSRAALLESSQLTAGLTRDMSHIGLLNHYLPLLDEWYQKTRELKLTSPMREILEIEHQAIRIQLASLSVQKISRRLSEQIDLRLGSSAAEEYLSRIQEFLVSTTANIDDYQFVRDALDGSRSLLATVVTVADQGYLRTAPFRIFSRIIFAATLLLKATCISPTKPELANSITVIEAAKLKLTQGALDNMHPASKTAKLISLHINQLRLLLAAHERAPGCVNEVLSTTETDSTPTPGGGGGSLANLGFGTSPEVQGQDISGVASAIFELDPSQQMEGLSQEGNLPILSHEDWLSSDLDSLGFGYLLENYALDEAAPAEAAWPFGAEDNHWHFA